MQSDENYAQRRLLQYHQPSASNYKNAQQITVSQPRCTPPQQQASCSSTSSSTINSDSGSTTHTSSHTSSPGDNFKLDIEGTVRTNKTDKYGVYSSSSLSSSHQHEHPNEQRFYYVQPTRYTNATACHKVPSSDSNSNTGNTVSASLLCESTYEPICPMASNRTKNDIKSSEFFTSHHPFNDLYFPEKNQTSPVIYFSQQPECFSTTYAVEPPSPAPCDRFIPPPPLSPSLNNQEFHSKNSNLECYSNNAFPSPSPKSEHFPSIGHFILPPTSPSTDRQAFVCSPKKIPYPNSPSDPSMNSYEIDRYPSTSKSSSFCHPHFSYSTSTSSDYRYRNVSQNQHFQDHHLSPATSQTQTLPSKTGRYTGNARFNMENHFIVTDGRQSAENSCASTDNRYTFNPEFTQYKNSTNYKHPDRFATLPNLSSERFTSKQDKRYSDVIESNTQSTQHYQHVPSSAHIPVERYVPQTNSNSKDIYKYTSSTVHYQDRYMTINTCTVGISPSERYVPNTGDPYMRRDLGYHHHYRPQTPPQLYYQYQPNHQYHHRVRYTNNHRTPRCCVTSQENYSSPGSSSTNSVASGTCNGDPSYPSCTILSPSIVRTPKVQCMKHMCVTGGNMTASTPEYVGASGGRLISSSSPGTPLSTLPQSAVPPIDGCVMNHCNASCDVIAQCSGGIVEKTKPALMNNITENNPVAIPNVCCAVVAGGTRKLVQQKVNKTPVKYNTLSTLQSNSNSW